MGEIRENGEKVLTSGADGLFYGLYHPLVARGLQAHFGEVQRAGYSKQGKGE